MRSFLRRGSFGSLAAVVLGVPLGLLAVIFCLNSALLDGDYRRYVEHPVEQAEIVLFVCGVLALAVKLLGWMRERAALARAPLPGWNGRAVSVSEAGKLREQIAEQPGLNTTWLGRRLHSALDFLTKRGSAAQLDDQLRTLADNDAVELVGSYSLVRFITWAIPILGFLGTVVGITAAVAGVTPEVLEQSLDGVTSGLATAFDTTALALVLTMVLMFGSFLVERLEAGMLREVDAYVDAELGHRFERTGEASPIIEAMRTSAQSLVLATEQLVERQADIWARSLENVERHWHDAAPKQAEALQRSLEQALDAALKRHALCVQQVEQEFLTRSAALLAGFAGAADRLGQHAQALEALGDQQAQLVRLQEALQENLTALAGSGAFEQAVHSLSAAIHLLTTRVQGHRSLAA
jgi:biopolymer transport protein ExbB/TolQ